jgi:hypothetical protein
LDGGDVNRPVQPINSRRRSARELAPAPLSSRV